MPHFQGTFDGNWEEIPQAKKPQEESALAQINREMQEKKTAEFNRGKALSDALERGEQPMFMTGQEIKSHFNPYGGDFHSNETDSDFWRRKETQAKDKFREGQGVRGSKVAGPRDKFGGYKGSLEQAMKKKGNIVGTIPLQHQKDHPLGFGMGQMLGGHHRVALASTQFKNMILPVSYHSSIEAAQQDPKYR